MRRRIKRGNIIFNNLRTEYKKLTKNQVEINSSDSVLQNWFDFLTGGRFYIILEIHISNKQIILWLLISMLSKTYL